MLYFAVILSFLSLLCAAPAQNAPGAVASAGIMPQDSLALLANKWVLRERLHEKDGKLQPVIPLEALRLELYPGQTYKLIRQHKTVSHLNSMETVEWGNWEVNEDWGLISVQVTNVDGRSILSAMLNRWQIEQLTPQQLVLNEFGFGDEILVFERAK